MQPITRTSDDAPKVVGYWNQVFDGKGAAACLGFFLLFIVIGILLGNEGAQLCFPIAGVALVLFFLIPFTSKEKRQQRANSKAAFNTWVLKQNQPVNGATN